MWRRRRDSNSRYPFEYTHFLPFANGTPSTIRTRLFTRTSASSISKTLYTSCFSYSLFLFPLSTPLFLNGKLQNILILVVVWLLYIYSFRQNALTFAGLNLRIDQHKKKNPSGFEGYRHRSVLSCGGDGEIRTRDTLSSIHTFQACSFNHSDTSPFLLGNKNNH